MRFEENLCDKTKDRNYDFLLNGYLVAILRFKFKSR